MNHLINDRIKNYSLVWLLFSLLIIMASVMASSNVEANDNSYQVQGSQSQYSRAELAQMLAPIALYPDSLLTHILIASTYPLEIVQAQRWLTEQAQYHDYSGGERDIYAAEQDWDPSVKALLPFASVLERLNDDLAWTQQLGDAFLLDEAGVLQSIQALRKRAKLTGHLASMENMQVSYDRQAIVIEPTRHDIVYVPYYDVRVVYGDWQWRHYPPVYWSAPHYLNAHYRAHYQPFYWHTGVHISAQLFFGAVHWHNKHLVIVQPSHNYRHKPSYYHRKKVITSQSAKRWQHKPHHRRGVGYKHRGLNKKFNKKYDKKHNKKFAHQMGRERPLEKRELTLASHHANKHYPSRVKNKKKHHANQEQAIKNSAMKTKHNHHKQVKSHQGHNKPVNTHRNAVSNKRPQKHLEPRGKAKLNKMQDKKGHDNSQAPSHHLAKQQSVANTKRQHQPKQARQSKHKQQTLARGHARPSKPRALAAQQRHH